MRLGPAHVHAQQHLRPVLRLGAAGAGVDLEVAVVGVGLARQQAFELALGGARLQGLELALRLVDAGLVALGLAQLGQRSEEHTSELQSLMRISYAVFCLKKKTQQNTTKDTTL